MEIKRRKIMDVLFFFCRERERESQNSTWKLDEPSAAKNGWWISKTREKTLENRKHFNP